MSDLAATNCGGCTCGHEGGNNCCIWLIILLLFCGGRNDTGCGCNGISNIFDGGDCGCNLIWIILLLCCCGGF